LLLAYENLSTVQHLCTYSQPSRHAAENLRENDFVWRKDPTQHLDKAGDLRRAARAHHGVDLLRGQAGAFQRVQQAVLDALGFSGDERLELGAGDGLPKVDVVPFELDRVKLLRRQRDLGALDLVEQVSGIAVDPGQQLFCAMRC